MADSVIWGAIACLLSSFDFAKAKDEHGQDIDVQPLFNDALVRYYRESISENNRLRALLPSYPLPYKCSITPRSLGIRKLVRETALRSELP